MSDVKHDYVRSKLAGLNELDLIEVNGLFAQLIEQAKADLRAEGFRDAEIRLDAFLDLRYAGQGYELTVPCPLPPLKKSDLDLMRQRFDTQHEQASGHKAETEPVELVSLRLISYGLVPRQNFLPQRRREEALTKRRPAREKSTLASSMACSPARSIRGIGWNQDIRFPARR